MDLPASHFGDIPLEIEAEIEGRSLSLEDLLDLRPGNIVKCSRAAGDSVNVRVGQQLIGQGEIIVVNNTLAVRLSDFDERS